MSIDLIREHIHTKAEPDFDNNNRLNWNFSINLQPADNLRNWIQNKFHFVNPDICIRQFFDEFVLQS